jgi:nucleoid DNA-binding protein
MRKSGIGNDKIVKINARSFYSMIFDVIDIDAEVCKSIYKLFIKTIHNEIQCGNIVHLEGLGYFHLIMIDKVFVRKHERQGNVDSEILVMPSFSPTVTVTSKYTQLFGEENVADGINIMKGYIDKLGKVHREALDKIIHKFERGEKLFEDEGTVRDDFDKRIEYFQQKIKKLKNDKRSILHHVYGKNLDGRQSKPHEKLPK